MRKIFIKLSILLLALIFVIFFKKSCELILYISNLFMNVSLKLVGWGLL